MPTTISFVLPPLMLVASNIFMTFAWYGHLKHKGTAIALAVTLSWGIAFFEYCLAVPANRLGSAVYSTAQLKTIQEVIKGLTEHFSMAFMSTVVGLPVSAALRAVLLVTRSRVEENQHVLVHRFDESQ